MMMAIVAMMVTTKASAQYEPGTWSIQPKVGIGFSQITNMENLDMGTAKLDNQITYAASSGVEFEYQASKMLGVAAGLCYGVQGTGWKDFKQGDEKMKNPRVELEYIQVPIIANVYVTKGLALKAGVQFGFLVDSNVKMTYDGKVVGRDATMDASIDMKNDFNKFDLSIPVGVSYEFKSHWVLDARYHIGLTKLNKESLSNGKDWKNSMFLMSVGYKFDL